MKSPLEDVLTGNRQPVLLNDRPSVLFDHPHWTTEDRCLLALLFEPQKAESLLAHATCRSTPPRHAPDWTRLVEKARQEGVSALIFYHITGHYLEDLVPQETLSTLSDDYHATLKRNLLIIGTLRAVLAAFQEAGIPCIVLKGIALAEHVYPSIGMRGMSDVDILVRKEALLSVDLLLSSLGYHPEDISAEKALLNPAGYLASLEYRKNRSPLNLHVHWHTVNTSVPATMFVNRVDMNRLWENAVPANVADSHTLMLRPEHAILYLCEHALRVGHSFDRLILICDIFFSMKTFATVMNWDFLIEESRRFHLSRLVYFGMVIVRQYTGLEIPGDCIAKLRPAKLSWGERRFLRLQLGNRRSRGNSYLLYLAMNRRLSDKARFIFRTFFPPPQILLQRQYRKDAKFANALYLARIGEGFSYLWSVLTTERR
jgi:hypothetical protein